MCSWRDHTPPRLDASEPQVAIQVLILDAVLDRHGGQARLAMTRRAVRADVVSSLLQLNQSPAKILGVQEKHWLSVRAGLWLTAAQHTGTSRNETVARSQDIVHLVADMMDAAFCVPFQKFCNGRLRPQRLQKLNLRIGQGDEDGRDAMLRLRHGFG